MNIKQHARALLAGGFGALALSLCPTPSSAVVVYSEAQSGDLPGDQNEPVPIGTFAIGSNVVVGQDAIGTDTSSQGDTFGLNLLAGQRIDSIALTISNNTNTADSFAVTAFQSPFVQVRQLVLAPGSSGVVSFTPFAAQPPGQYNFSTQFDTDLQPAQGFDWQWNIQVSGVPEPGVTPLLLLGLAGIAWTTRRRA